MKGGIGYRSGYTNRDAALTDFFNNSTLTLLSNNSISCINFIATLNNGVESPFLSTRSGGPGIGSPITKLLFKFFPMSGTARKGWRDILDRPGYGGIELAANNAVQDEFDRQLDIYRKTFMTEESYFDAICPYPLHYSVQNSNFINEIIPKTVGRDRQDKMNLDQTITNTLGGANIGIIIMEFMDGWMTYGDMEDDRNISWDQKHFLENMRNYELEKLHRLGYFHGDFHDYNSMVSLTHEYITDNQGPKHLLGRVLIIDFGRTRPLDDQENAGLRSGYYNHREFKDKDFNVRRLARRGEPGPKWNNIGGLSTFDEVYQRRRDVRNMIKGAFETRGITPFGNKVNIYQQTMGDNPSELLQDVRYQQYRQQAAIEAANTLPPPPPQPQNHQEVWRGMPVPPSRGGKMSTTNNTETTFDIENFLAKNSDMELVEKIMSDHIDDITRKRKKETFNWKDENQPQTKKRRLSSGGRKSTKYCKYRKGKSRKSRKSRKNRKNRK